MGGTKRLIEENYVTLIENSDTEDKFRSNLYKWFKEATKWGRSYFWEIRDFVVLSENQLGWLHNVIKETYDKEILEHYEEYIEFAHDCNDWGYGWYFMSDRTVEYMENFINVCERYKVTLIDDVNKILYFLRKSNGNLQDIYMTAIRLKQSIIKKVFIDYLEKFSDEMEGDLEVLTELTEYIGINEIQSEWMKNYMQKQKRHESQRETYIEEILKSEEAKAIFDKISYCVKDGELYKWTGSASLFGYFVMMTSVELELRGVEDRLPLKKYETIFQCDKKTKNGAIQFASRFRTNYYDKKLKPKGHKEIDDVCPSAKQKIGI